MTRADRFELDFECLGDKETLTVYTNGQEAQRSKGLCHGLDPDVANLPAGEIYYVPESAEGRFPLVYEADGTIGAMEVVGGKIRHAILLRGNQGTVDMHNRKIQDDPVTGELGELGFGTQVLPVSGADIQDEKILGTMHLATGRSDHLGGNLTPDKFNQAQNATHDDILFAPHKTPDVKVPQVRMYRGGEEVVLLENYQPAPYLQGLLKG